MEEGLTGLTAEDEEDPLDLKNIKNQISAVLCPTYMNILAPISHDEKEVSLSKKQKGKTVSY